MTRNNENNIAKMYTEECMSTYEIAKELNTYPNKIRRYLKKNGIELKNKSSAQKNALDKGISKIPTRGKRRSKEDRTMHRGRHAYQHPWHTRAGHSTVGSAAPG